MAEATTGDIKTIGDINKRLGAIEERLQTATFEGGLHAEEEAALESEAEAIRVILAKAIAERTGEDPKVIYEMREKVRQLNLIAEIVYRVEQNFPDNTVANQAVQDLAQGKISPEEFISVQLPRVCPGVRNLNVVIDFLDQFHGELKSGGNRRLDNASAIDNN